MLQDSTDNVGALELMFSLQFSWYCAKPCTLGRITNLLGFVLGLYSFTVCIDGRLDADNAWRLRLDVFFAVLREICKNVHATVQILVTAQTDICYKEKE